MSASNPSENVDDADRPRRTTKRVVGGIVLVIAATVLLYGGIEALVDPDSVIAGSSHSGRRMDTEVEAKLGGMLLCFFGVTVLGFGIALFAKKKPSEGSPFGKPPE